MKRIFGGEQLAPDQIAYYPLVVPPIYSDKVVYNTMKVVLSGTGKPRLESSWQRATQGVVAWRISKLSVQNPLFAGDIYPYYTFITNLPFPSPMEGRINGVNRQVAATLFKPSTLSPQFTTETFSPDATTWFRTKNFIEIDNIMCQINGPDGQLIGLAPSAFWAVEFEFLYIVTQWE